MFTCIPVAEAFAEKALQKSLETEICRRVGFLAILMNWLI
jgi:hypothetical protein